ncbi:hypothetical protein K9L67_04310 [Candidatus Woesearchaeota archaeon]|nr:hypothetical protein [Candidatus Woesearchaeota archaeon]MCF7901422.1 hypothetical protein [Candidatus Woesearchaeota archaeon]MCF8012965.1 hypothetical protein [Candidatus Woesearchaeota archaeon]
MSRKKQEKNQKRRNKIIILAILFSIVFYVAGTITGLYANKIFSEQISQDLDKIKSDLDNSALDIKNIQLKQYYIENFNEDECKFMKIYNENQLKLIENFWSTLPKRMEEYEKNNELTEDYIAIKREYARFSLRYWLTLKNYNENCQKEEITPVLYFYTKDCQNCLEQAKEFDKFRESLSTQNKTLLVFPIDGEFNEDMITILKQYYEIQSYPTTIIKKQVIQGKVIDKQEMRLAINN